MVETQVILAAASNDHHHHFSIFPLNPNAPEFYPFYYFTPLPHNTTFITTNYYHHNYSHYYSPPPPPPPPRSATVQLPHHLFNHHHHHHANFQEYPFPHFTNPNNYQTNLPNNHPNDTPMHPHPQPQPDEKAHTRGPVPTRAARPKRVEYFRDDHRGGGVRSGNNNNNNNNNNNKGRKEEYKNGDHQGRGILGRWGKFKREVMPVKPGGLETTAMIRNVPNQYTREMLVKYVDEFCKKENQKLKEATDVDQHPPLAFDFLYLPIDFKRDANKGYAFVNFTHPTAVWKFHLACSDRGWEYGISPKICQIAYASIQGKEKLIKHFGQSKFICSQEEYLPVCFSPPRDGSGVPVELTTVGKHVVPSSSLLSRAEPGHDHESSM